MSVFADYSACYDLLYHDKDYDAEAAYVSRRLRQAAPAARSLLELGSGTGRHGRRLAAMGWHVHGIERSAEMVALARSAANDPAAAPHPEAPGSFRCDVGDVRHVRVSQTFDAVAALFHVVSYQTTNADVSATFRTAASHLTPGGHFLFDVWHGPAVVAQKPEVRVKRAGNEDLDILRIAEPVWEPELNRITVGYTVLATDTRSRTTTRFTEAHPMRYFFPLEIDLLAEAAGFTVVASEEWLSGHPPSSTTWGVAYLLRKL